MTTTLSLVKSAHSILRASKLDVIANDTKILEIFNKTIQEMFDGVEE